MKLIDFWDRTTFHLNKIVYYTIFGAAVLFMVSYMAPVFFLVAIIVLLFIAIGVLIDFYLLYRNKNGVEAERILTERLSNGDENKISIRLQNNFDHKISVTVIDELPFQLQQRNWKRDLHIEANAETVLEYFIKPQERGAYQFGNINVYVEGSLTLVQRRFIFLQEKTAKVYPSYIQMLKYQLHAIGSHLQESGVKRMRKLGHSMEFEQIKEYVIGDDYRTLNWKASARQGNFMVNTFTDERSQQIYCIINKGRVMKMPFGGMTLLDYAINASLVLLNVALQKQDKAGLITFAEKADAFIAADKSQHRSIRFWKHFTNSKPHFQNLILKNCFRLCATVLRKEAC